MRRFFYARKEPMTTRVTTAPTVEPLTLAEAKVHLREDLTDAGNDALITSKIKTLMLADANVPRVMAAMKRDLNRELNRGARAWVIASPSKRRRI